MSTRKIFLYVFISLIVIAALVVGGYALYRLGVTHGAQGISRLIPERRLIPDFNRQVIPDFWSRRSYVGFPVLLSIPGLIFRLGLIIMAVLAIYGGIKLLQSGRSKSDQTSSQQPSQPAPPVENPPATE